LFPAAKNSSHRAFAPDRQRSVPAFVLMRRRFFFEKNRETVAFDGKIGYNYRMASGKTSHNDDAFQLFCEFILVLQQVMFYEPKR
jgi:hypothetical protein